MELTESQTRSPLINPQLVAAGWNLSDRTQVRFEMPVAGYDPAPWNGITDFCLYHPSGRVLRVVVAKRALLSPENSHPELSEEAGLNINYECRSGVCGRCKTKLLSGCVTMEVQDALDESDKANNLILLCQAKATDHVTIEA